MHTYLEYVGEVSEVEYVVELDGGREEGGGDLLVQGEGCVHQLLRVLLHLAREASTGYVALEDAEVDRPQRVNLVGINNWCARVCLCVCVPEGS